MSVIVSGLDSIDKDFEAFKAELAGKVKNAMDFVGEEMKSALKQHVETDVYEAYEPAAYERRSKDPSLGSALSDMEANAMVFNKGAGVSLVYLPSGDHRTKKWATDNGDDIIGRIEKKSPPYNWESAERPIPLRPFWQNFVDEMTDGQALLQYFANAMAMQGVVIEPDDGGVQRGAEDGGY